MVTINHLWSKHVFVLGGVFKLFKTIWDIDHSCSLSRRQTTVADVGVRLGSFQAWDFFARKPMPGHKNCPKCQRYLEIPDEPGTLPWTDSTWEEMLDWGWMWAVLDKAWMLNVEWRCNQMRRLNSTVFRSCVKPSRLWPSKNHQKAIQKDTLIQKEPPKRYRNKTTNKRFPNKNTPPKKTTPRKINQTYPTEQPPSTIFFFFFF